MNPKRSMVLGAVLFTLLLGGLFWSITGVQAIPFRLFVQTPVYLPVIVGQPAPTATRTTAPRPTATREPSREPTPGRTVTVPSGTILVNADSVDLFDRIPEQYLRAAREMPVMFLDRSVGDNISEGLDCLAGANDWAQTLSQCRRHYNNPNDVNSGSKTYVASDLANGLVPDLILFDPDPARYSRGNWTYEYYQDESWEDLTRHFIQSLAPSYLNSKEVLTFEFSYLAVGAGSSIEDGDDGFFVDHPHNGYHRNGAERWDISDIEEFQAAHPDKIFFFWTSSLSRQTGSPESDAFNEQVRQYTAANRQPLLDVADILSREPDGTPCYDNDPGDGQNNRAICQLYTTESNGGHLGAVSGGKIRVAKAFWVMMAQLAGWQP